MSSNRFDIVFVFHYKCTCMLVCLWKLVRSFPTRAQTKPETKETSTALPIGEGGANAEPAVPMPSSGDDGVDEE
jgi:hypothetical protein